MFCEEAGLRKNIFSAPADFNRRHRLCNPSLSMRSVAGFSLLGFWKENNSALLLGAIVVFVIVIFVWLMLRRRRDAFPEIKFEVEKSELEKGMTMIESQPDEAVRPAPQGDGRSRPASFPGIYGKIEVIVGNQQVGTYLVTDNPLTIGRDPAQALAIIQEAIVSKLHCSIFYRDGQIFIKDLNSTNGTYVNDEKVSERELQDNDIVFLGKKGTIKIIYHK
jgi:hypothetical protein